MRALGIILIVVAASCSTQPEPIVYGQDACHTCKMTLMDERFGAELVTDKGKIYKFDDVNCMLNYYGTAEKESVSFAHKLVADFSEPTKLIDATNAFYLKSAEIKSPMASQIAAFSSKEKMEETRKSLDGIYMVWGELVTQFK